MADLDIFEHALRNHLAAKPPEEAGDFAPHEAAIRIEKALLEWETLRDAYVRIISARLLREWLESKGLDL